MTAEELAAELRVSRSKLYSMMAREQVPAPIRIGSRPRWRREVVEAWLAAGAPVSFDIDGARR